MIAIAVSFNVYLSSREMWESRGEEKQTLKITTQQTENKELF
jgi:hypothetical protein